MLDRERKKSSSAFDTKIIPKKVIFDSLNDIGEDMILLQLMDSIVNFNHAVSIVRK